jgi:hypothetical protein
VVLVSTGVLWMWGIISAWAASTEGRVRARWDAEAAMIEGWRGVEDGLEALWRIGVVMSDGDSVEDGEIACLTPA